MLLRGTKVQFDLGITQAKGKVIKENEKTVIVRLPNGMTVKRHKEKHNVRTENA